MVVNRKHVKLEEMENKLRGTSCAFLRRTWVTQPSLEPSIARTSSFVGRADVAFASSANTEGVRSRGEKF